MIHGWLSTVVGAGNAPQRRGRLEVAGHLVKAGLAVTALALLSAWLALPGPAMAQTQFLLTPRSARPRG